MNTILGKGGKYDGTHERRMEEIKAEMKDAAVGHLSISFPSM